METGGNEIMSDILQWLENWYKTQCNEDWEHQYGIKIESLDNPGWWITIDLKDTCFENIKINSESIENDENDWYFFHYKDKKYEASGDPKKLEFLLIKFKEIIESYNIS